MPLQFTSNSVHKVDGKGRVSVPRAFRDVLRDEGGETQLFLVPGFRDPRAIEGYGLRGHGAIGAQIARMHPADRNRKRLEHKFLGRSQSMLLDDTGRIVLSPALRERFELTSEARFVGVGESFQIWNPVAYDAFEAELWDDEDDVDALAALPWPAAGGEASDAGGAA